MNLLFGVGRGNRWVFKGLGVSMLSALWLALPLSQAGTLPEWVNIEQEPDRVLWLQIPAQMNQEPPQTDQLELLVLRLDPSWNPNWRQAAFELKNLIVTVRTKGPNVRVGLEASEAQTQALMGQELAAYIEGYVFEDNPFIPDGDETGKLWQKVAVAENQVLTTLVDAASIGIAVVLFTHMKISPEHRSFLNFIDHTATGSLDIQPELANLPQENAQFFFAPETGDYHLGIYAPKDEETEFYFDMSPGLKVTLLYPEGARFRHRQYGRRTEIRLFGASRFYFFLLEPKERAGSMESLQIVERKAIDPYELVVKNQVFKDAEDQKFQSLQVDELQNYNYQTPGGVGIDVTFNDTVIIRKGRPIERLRRELYLGGVKWRSKKLPELPLIEPEKVQSVPLDIDLNKSYNYTYLGDGNIDGHPVWKVRFAPQESGDFFSGTVWIDKETGAHRKLRAIQSGLEAPVIGNEVTAYFDWVESDGQRFWTQLREENLQIINIAGLRLVLQINSRRQNFRFNQSDVERVLERAYQSDLTILRDTPKGFRYLTKKGDQRVLSQDSFSSKKAILGGVFFDPGLDTPLPLGGFNYTNLDFLKKGYQANFFLAGALNDLIISHPDFLGRGWDFTAELFATAIYFSDRVFEGDEEREDLEVEELSESVNLTLGIPLNSFFKFSANYSLRYLDYQEADDTDPDYVIPSSTLEHIGRLNLEYSRKRFISAVQYEFVKRSDWEAFGFPADNTPVEDGYRKVQLDASLSKRLPKFQTITVDLRYLKGWDLDRFSRFGFGFFENRVSGFGTSGIEGDEALRLRLDYEIGISGLFNLDLSLDGARAWLDDIDANGVILERDPVDLAGVGMAMNFLGPWKTLIRLDLGFGIHSDLAGEDGDITGQILFLRLF